jgi:hypothetical protein
MSYYELNVEEQKRRKKISENTRKMIQSRLTIEEQDEL